MADSSSGASRSAPWFGGTALVLALLLWALRDIVILVGLALVLAYALEPLVSGLLRIQVRGVGMPRGAAALLVVLAVVIAIVGVLAFGIPRLAAELVRFAEGLPDIMTRLREDVRVWAEARGLGDFVAPLTQPEGEGAFDVSSALTGSLARGVPGLLGGLGQAFGLLVLPVLAFYLLAEREDVRASAMRFVPERFRDRAAHVEDAVDRALHSYVRGQALVCLIVGAATAAVLAMMNYPYTVFLAALAGFAEVVPYVGFAVAAIAIGIAGLTVDPVHAMIGVAGYFIVNTAVGVFVTPRVMGRYLTLHPFVATVSVLAGAKLLGAGGVFLALPLAAVIQALAGEFRGRRAPRGS